MNKKIFISLFLFTFFLTPAIAAEKFTPAGSKQGPKIFVQLAKESIIYCSGLKFMQEAQA